MKAAVRKVFSVLMIVPLISMVPRTAVADPTKEFLMSCTYGVLAGTLVGAATLAFRDKPGDNLRSIARGASLGLYAGIALGVYIINFVPGANDVSPEEAPSDSPFDPPPQQEQLEEDALLKPLVYPIFSENFRLEGAGIQMNILNF